MQTPSPAVATLARRVPLIYHCPMWPALANRLKRLLLPLLVLLAFTAAAAPEWPRFEEERHRLNALVAVREFDFLSWLWGAVSSKGEAAAVAGQDYLEAGAQQGLVLDYLAHVAEARRLQREIERVYADPAVADPGAAAAPLQQTLAATRARMAELQPVAEAIVQEQVAAVLAAEGFGLLGAIFPPVQMHMTPLPLVLIVSPREEIKQLYNVPLQHGLPVAVQEELEDAVWEELDRSALVVPIGGLGLYPAMIVETGNLTFLADVVAHEWAHHWLTLQPVGMRYAASSEMRTINETVASIVGAEVGALVVARFYPHLAPPPAAESEAPEAPPEPPTFDFRAEMAETRRQVDALLAADEVEAAEAYMEERRTLFVEHGYQIRKLNQAYFAFYGAYADTPGATGDDPVGPAVVALREQSASLHDFLRRVAPVTSFEQLQEEVRAAP
ncbi:MAG: hypothetical protein RRC07_09975 [Anaerolineae bacterium]|nr:hypothetical protein [Anaerolineae bacterium]